MAERQGAREPAAWRASGLASRLMDPRQRSARRRLALQTASGSPSKTRSKEAHEPYARPIGLLRASAPLRERRENLQSSVRHLGARQDCLAQRRRGAENDGERNRDVGDCRGAPSPSRDGRLKALEPGCPRPGFLTPLARRIARGTMENPYRGQSCPRIIRATDRQGATSLTRRGSFVNLDASLETAAKRHMSHMPVPSEFSAPPRLCGRKRTSSSATQASAVSPWRSFIAFGLV